MAGFWSNLFGRGEPIPHAAMTPNVTYVGGPGELLDELGVEGILRMSVAKLWRSQPHLRTVVSFRARNVAHLGIHAFERSGEDRRRDRTSPLAQALSRPNPDQTLYDLIFSLVGDLDLYDRAYWLVAPDVDAPSGWVIRRLPPSWVSVSKKNAFSVTEYLVSSGDGGESVRVPADQILAFAGYHPTSPLAVSPAVESLRATLAEQVEAAKYRGQVWKRGGRVSAVLQRPKDAPGWSDAAREAFREDWYAKYTGNGPKAGGTPILEDGMTLQRVDFNAQEQQFVEAAKLALTTVASVYHVNPAMVGVLDNANFSNMREFRRMLYSDSLGPTLAQIEGRLNAFLLPMLGADPARQYVEFNVAEKLQGSFEEQAQVMQTMVGAPIMTRNEGRGKFNLPAVDGGDELVTPLNVLVGGQASPTDSGSQNRGEASAPAARKTAVAALKARVTDRQAEKVAEVLQAFFRRQGKSVLSAIGAGGEWWDAKRWDEELSDDLYRVAVTLSETLGKAEAEALGFEAGDYDPAVTLEFLRAASERHAKNINLTTKGQLDAAVADDEADPADVFAKAEDSRATGVAAGVSVFLAGFATREAAQQISRAYVMDASKTWVTGTNPRPTHAAMDGETVAIDENFSNGLPWPGAANGIPDETAGCNCSMTITLTPKEG